MPPSLLLCTASWLIAKRAQMALPCAIRLARLVFRREGWGIRHFSVTDTSLRPVCFPIPSLAARHAIPHGVSPRLRRRFRRADARATLTCTERDTASTRDILLHDVHGNLLHPTTSIACSAYHQITAPKVIHTPAHHDLCRHRQDFRRHRRQ